jgi:hypothetical protein
MSASLRIPRARLLSASQSKQYIDEYECLGQSALQTRVNLLKNGEAASRIGMKRTEHVYVPLFLWFQFSEIASFNLTFLYQRV